MLKNKDLAKIGYEAYRRELTRIFGYSELETLSWDQLSLNDQTAMIEFASVVATTARTDIENKIVGAYTTHEAEEEKKAERFREAVHIAFRQMMIRSVEETAAWYTLRDWLKEDKK